MDASSSILVAGQPLAELPADLFIPPDALEVLLDSFTGPLDLLLYLIRRQDLDILDIPIASISQQYLQYIQLLKAHRLELAADYLVMAAMLAEIKSRLLLPPRSTDEEDLEEDPRMELVKKLKIYEQFKQAANMLDKLPRWERDVFPVCLAYKSLSPPILYPEVDLASLSTAIADLRRRQSHLVPHQIRRELLSVCERMALVLAKLSSNKSSLFTDLLRRAEGRGGLVVTFLAILELARQALLLIDQGSAYASIQLEVSQDG